MTIALRHAAALLAAAAAGIERIGRGRKWESPDALTLCYAGLAAGRAERHSVDPWREAGEFVPLARRVAQRVREGR